MNSRLRPSHVSTYGGWQRLSSGFGVLPCSALYSSNLRFFSGESSDLPNALSLVFRPEATAQDWSLQKSPSSKSHIQGTRGDEWRMALRSWLEFMISSRVYVYPFIMPYRWIDLFLPSSRPSALQSCPCFQTLRVLLETFTWLSSSPKSSLLFPSCFLEISECEGERKKDREGERGSKEVKGKRAVGGVFFFQSLQTGI